MFVLAQMTKLNEIRILFVTFCFILIGICLIGCTIFNPIVLELIDAQRLSKAINQNLFVRVIAEQKMVIIVASIVATILLLFVVSIFIIWWTSQKKGMKQQSQRADEENLELPSFDIVVHSKATRDFGDSNQIGEGGFGPVYKGKLPSGQDIAVKRSSENSDQRLNQFKNEVRKEKLGDRITALQQLVSPFGKTDTASVLQEAIGYIKFLEDRVKVLTTPYMEKRPHGQCQQVSTVDLVLSVLLRSFPFSFEIFL